MTLPSTIGGVAATNVPVKPLRREGIRCKKISRGSRSYPGIETIPAAGLSTAVAPQESQFIWPRLVETRAESTGGIY